MTSLYFFLAMLSQSPRADKACCASTGKLIDALSLPQRHSTVLGMPKQIKYQKTNMKGS